MIQYTLQVEDVGTNQCSLLIKTDTNSASHSEARVAEIVASHLRKASDEVAQLLEQCGPVNVLETESDELLDAHKAALKQGGNSESN